MGDQEANERGIDFNQIRSRRLKDNGLVGKPYRAVCRSKRAVLRIDEEAKLSVWGAARKDVRGDCDTRPAVAECSDLGDVFTGECVRS